MLELGIHARPRRHTSPLHSRVMRLANRRDIKYGQQQADEKNGKRYKGVGGGEEGGGTGKSHDDKVLTCLPTSWYARCSGRWRRTWGTQAMPATRPMCGRKTDTNRDTETIYNNEKGDSAKND